ncbi:formimidoylglutamase [Xenorhabdus mauleonii]|uniref:Formimidoylglutamase n=1 Tax=Xenorhabdus mauleonii TaxID=351675 RepID=A0A1I3JC57_9GAMM|nr:formimidoylglutamase [Xenorhabdus mauleonii]PHM46158.1 formimidoylglutamase [Xenorhabdus mauleonii]SFI57535.1 formiminoglutamase [Xenorhabdus mauleonii]
MNLWHPISENIWQGRNDLAEADNALRVFQVIQQPARFPPEEYPHHIALLGFECDEGVKLNQGRPGAKLGPDYLRQSLANLASYDGHDRLVDLGNIRANPEKLSEAQGALSDAVYQCQQQKMKTLIFGGGHETAFAHGMGVYRAFPTQRVGIINFDAHLDLRNSPQPTSGTPFRQLAHYCQQQQRLFNYTCVGASLASNTQALLDEANHLDVTIIWDTHCVEPMLDKVQQQLQDIINQVDIIYMTIDLDVLPIWQMPAVSAPAALGVPLDRLLPLIQLICQSKKLQAVDLVELNPLHDIQGMGGKAAARLAWQLVHWWNG